MTYPSATPDYQRGYYAGRCHQQAAPVHIHLSAADFAVPPEVKNPPVYRAGFDAACARIHNDKRRKAGKDDWLRKNTGISGRNHEHARDFADASYQKWHAAFHAVAREVS